MASYDWKIYIATVLLEKNRWTNEARPSFLVSAWAPRIMAAGFDGIELWANHALLNTEEEQGKLAKLCLPIAIYSAYVPFDDASIAARRKAAQLIARYKTRGVKFNFGNDAAAIPAYVKNLQAWQGMLPKDCRLLCECHRHTVLEKPERAKEILAPLGDSVGIIVHAFADDVSLLQGWFKSFGPRVCHVHSACGDKDGNKKLRQCANVVRERMNIMRGEGFRGTFTIEFTAGVAKPTEDMEALLKAAADDMTFLREELAQW